MKRNALAVPSLPGTVTTTGWQGLGRLTLPDARALARAFGGYLRLAGSAFQWAFADLANAIEDSLGEPGWQAIDELAAAAGYTEPTAMNVMRVGRAFAFARRRKALTFAHHAVVVGVKSAVEQDRWLAQAEQEDWTRAELRRHLGTNDSGPDPPHPPHTCKHCEATWTGQ